MARRCGVSTDTVRHYEKLGLLKPAGRPDGRYREYGSDAIERLRTIRAAVGVGFTLADLQRFLRVRDRGGAPCRQVRAAAAARLAEVDGRIRELQDLRGLLERVLATWDEKLDRTPDGAQARLLDMLPRENP